MPENVNSNAAGPGKSPDYVKTESNLSDADCDNDFDAVEAQILIKYPTPSLPKTNMSQR